MRVLKVLFLAALGAVLLSLCVRGWRSHKVHKSDVAVARVEAQRTQDVQPSSDSLRAPASAYEQAMEGVNDMLWIQSATFKGQVSTSVRIDPSVQRLVVAANCVPKKCSLRVTDPSGHEQASGGPVTLLDLIDGGVGVIQEPEKGNWSVTVTGDGQVELKVYAATSLGIDFVKLSDPLHKDHSYDVTAGAEVPGGGPLKGEVAISSLGPLQADFKVVTVDGTELPLHVEAQPKDVREPHDSNKRQVTYALEFSAPQSDFRLLVRGHDARGQRFQRIMKPAIRVVHTQ